jgi:hypothetical protein
MTATGLDKRIALSILSRVGIETRHVVMGTILVGFVIAFLVPSTTARVACLVPITLGIIAAFGVRKRSAFAGMLMITTVQTASIWNVGIKTAAAQNMVAVGFIERTLHTTVTWLEWFLAASPFAAKSLAELGPMKPSEKKLLAISLTHLRLNAQSTVAAARSRVLRSIRSWLTAMFGPRRPDRVGTTLGLAECVQCWGSAWTTPLPAAGRPTRIALAISARVAPPALPA